MTSSRRLLVSERLKKVEAYRAVLRQGSSRNAAARRLGRSRATLDRWNMAFEIGGSEALKPRFHLCGRRRIDRFQQVLTPAVVKGVRALAIQLGSIDRAWLQFAAHPDCPRPIADFLGRTRRVNAELRHSLGLRRNNVTIWTDKATAKVLDLQPINI